MKRMTYQQFEVIRERAKALGLTAEFEHCAVSTDPTRPDPCLSIRPVLPEGGSITYYLDSERLTSLMSWGPFAPAAREIDAIHAALTADFVEPPPPARCERCGAVLEDSERRLCAPCDAALASFWASVEVPS